MIVGLCQFDLEWENKKTNRSKIISLIENCESIKKIDWLIFPEMTLTGFSMKSMKTTLSDKDIDFFKDISRNFSLYTTFGGVIDNRNSLITIDKDGNTIAEYAKMHLIPHYGENVSYVPGDKLCGFEIMGMRVSPSICYDLRFSYLFWEQASTTDIYVNIANWPMVRDLHWITLLRARAIENQAYMIGVNRVGKDPKSKFLGNSNVISPTGDRILKCNDLIGIFSVKIEKTILDKIKVSFPVLDHRKDKII